MSALAPKEAICGLPYREPVGVPCYFGPGGHVDIAPGPSGFSNISPSFLRADASKIATLNYPQYSRTFLYPSNALMVKTGLWIELEAVIGLIVGLGLASLMGQRTVPVVLMIVLEIILTPIFSHTVIPHMINAQRGIVGLAMAHLEPGGLPRGLGGGGPGGAAVLVPESTTVAVLVIVAWLVVWTALGAWRMNRRDA